ncbi:TonB-dependent receptor plug domain-containing protein [Rhodocytophaga rosea]|uniref:TonB-dependent receptor plug domain-containing protein n=1 Tax=Rhodocytophaga rosea TaxID=2704465 RepID=A0A6C0GNR9_9BACT|nr:TonB-dependent receptor plug domain-containing protein [Rhodocytophaga rosea]QHT69270.1 TonB-dependent receptor plug domain-containing protein [Rhodocytophaga rosea]
MKKYTFLFLGFLYLCFNVHAQTIITGKVLDAQTQEPVEAAQLYTPNLILLGTTNAEGNFEIRTDTLISSFTVNSLGYTPQTIQIKAGQTYIEIRLQESIRTLNEVVVTGYETNRKLIETAGSIALLSNVDLQRFSNTSLLPAVNTVPGVRMEERSPGSYRLSIRGSLIRAPFGVRNVKVYWNDIPFTDPGGNTYLNLMDFNAIQNMEIIKGPAGSIYGAGTGGTVLLQSLAKGENKPGVQVSGIVGSYGLKGLQTLVQTDGDTPLVAGYSRLESDGYREQSAMRRDMFHFYYQPFKSEKRTIQVSGFYSDLYYQTPGGLTRAQFQQNPRLSRPAAGPNRSSIEQKAAIYNKTFFVGASQQYTFNSKFSNSTSIYATSGKFENPFISNYERRAEQGFGGRTKFAYVQDLGNTTIKYTAGAEFQTYFASDRVYGNNLGQPDTLQFDDEIGATQYFIFAQAELELPHDIVLTAGASYNRLTYNLLRLSGVPPFQQQDRKFSPVVSPRIALLKNWHDRFALHGSIGFGYSPPAITEVRPSEATFNTGLKPEIGVNYELGFRGSLLQNRYSFDLTGFSLQLRETIVRRSTDSGAEYFINAGATSQKGIELANSFALVNNPAQIISGVRLLLNYTFNDFKYKNYQQNTTDFSGKKIAGVAPNIVVAGIDVQSKPGFYANITYTYTDIIPLNDANSENAVDYTLLSGRIGWKKQFNLVELQAYAGIDNALNTRYSLGNDLNAFGNRFFNPAADRNYYGGVSVKYLFKARD